MGVVRNWALSQTRLRRPDWGTADHLSQNMAWLSFANPPAYLQSVEADVRASQKLGALCWECLS